MDFGEPNRRSFISFIFRFLILSFICPLAFAAAPVAVDDVRTIPIGSVLTLNVLSNDFDSDGDDIQIITLNQPQNGSAALSGNTGTIIYTPAADFIGTDSFTYEIQEQIVNGLTATATVTVNVRENGFITSLATTSNMRNLAQAIERACAYARNLSDAELGDTGRLLLQRCDDLEQIAQQNPGSVQSVLEQIGPDEALSQARVSAADTRIQTQAVTKRIEHRKMIGPGSLAKHDLNINGLAVTGNSLGNRGGGASADEGSLYSPLGFFASLQLEESEYDKNYFETGYESTNHSITFGVDYYLTRKWLLGAALGYSTQDITYNNEDGNMDVSSLTFLAFTSYQYGLFSFDLQAGLTNGQLDMGRRIHYSSAGIELDQLLTSNTDSTQFLIHGQAQWEWHSGSRSIYPFISLDFKTTEISPFGEVGFSGWEMDVREQSEEQVTVALGVQSAWALKASWGVLLPTLSLSALSDSLSQRNIMFGKLAYDSLPDNDYFFDGQETETLYYELSLGASALFKHGISAFVEYRHTIDYEFYETFQFQFGFRQAF